MPGLLKFGHFLSVFFDNSLQLKPAVFEVSRYDEACYF